MKLFLPVVEYNQMGIFRRQLSFKEIAAKTQLPLNDVERLVMKALANELIKGRIDQVSVERYYNVESTSHPIVFCSGRSSRQCDVGSATGVESAANRRYGQPHRAVDR